MSPVKSSVRVARLPSVSWQLSKKSSMKRRRCSALLVCGAAVCFSIGVGADIAVEASIPDPARAWETRNLASVEAWLTSETDVAAAHGENRNALSVPVLRARAWLARRENEDDRALALIDRAIELAPDRAELRVDRAAFRSDRIEESGALKSLRIARDVRRDLEHAVAVAPLHEDALAALAAFHLRAPGIAGGDKLEAEALLARLGELAPARRSFREAIELAAEERIAEAVDRIIQAISLAGGPKPNWRIRMGDWLHRLGRDDDALEAYRLALLDAPQHAGALYAFGRTAAESGLETDAGIDALERYVELKPWPKDPEIKFAWWQLGRLHARVGCVENAAAAFRRALALDPGWRAPRRALERLGDEENRDRSCGPETENHPADQESLTEPARRDGHSELSWSASASDPDPDPSTMITSLACAINRLRSSTILICHKCVDRPKWTASARAVI